MTVVTFVGSFPAAAFEVFPQLPEIAFVGRSNAGKSSLINALCGTRTLARVSKTPGKTRAANVYNVGGRWYLVDLPGYGFARGSPPERSALQRLLREYLASRPGLAGVVWLLDARREPAREDREIAERLGERRVPLLVAITKLDKITRSRRRARVRAILEAVSLPEDQCVPTSARTGEGLHDLRASIAALVDRRLDGRTAGRLGSPV